MLFSSNFSVQVIGKLFIDGYKYTEIDVVDNIAHAQLKAADNAVVCCAVLDPVKKLVYVNNGCETTHSSILEYNDLPKGSQNQTDLHSIIHGFILSGGYFANRLQTSRHIVTTPDHHIARKRLRGEDPNFHTAMIDWYAVRCNIDTGRYKKAEQFDVDEVWNIQELTDAL